MWLLKLKLDNDCKYFNSPQIISCQIQNCEPASFCFDLGATLARCGLSFGLLSILIWFFTIWVPFAVICLKLANRTINNCKYFNSPQHFPYNSLIRKHYFISPQIISCHIQNCESDSFWLTVRFDLGAFLARFCLSFELLSNLVWFFTIWIIEAVWSQTVFIRHRNRWWSLLVKVTSTILLL